MKDENSSADSQLTWNTQCGETRFVVSKIVSKKTLVNRKFCENSFSEVGSLKRHINTEGNKDYKCESCDKSFSQKRNLKRHIHSSWRSQRLQM